MVGKRAELVIALAFLAFAVVTAVFWIPSDSETGLIETFRRQTTMGDAFLPFMAIVLLGISAFVQAITVLRRRDTGDPEGFPISGLDLAFLLQLVGVIAVSLTLMYWLGPLAVQVFAQGDGDAPVTYRQMRSTFPYSLVGFLIGGFVMVQGLTMLIEGRLRPIRLATSMLAVLALILIFDVPFDSVLLPPNGDW